MKKRDEKMILADDTATAGGMTLRYQLTDGGRDGSRFHIRAEHGNHFADVGVGSDLVFAVDCYRAVREGRVTPCTLEDVISDLRFQEGNFVNPLYK